MEMVSRAFGVIVAIVIAVATVILMGALSAKVFEDLWAWFVVPLGMRPISFLHAWGIMLLISFVTGGYVRDPVTKTDDSEAWGMFAKSLIALVSVWGGGFVVMCFMQGSEF